MAKERLQKLIAQAGICSRRRAEELISAGKVKLNNRVVTELGTRADPDRDKIEVENKRIQFEKKIYLLLYKPPGYITSASDEHGRPVVFDLVKETRRLFTAGRLDFHSEGALLLTNDGELAHRLTHPSTGVVKEYEVKVKGSLSKAQLDRVKEGVLLEDGVAHVLDVEPLRETDKNMWYLFTLTEGRNREIRRIVEAVGGQVLKLKRVSFAGLTIEEMFPGDIRPLTPSEILQLYEMVGLYQTDRSSRKKSEPTFAIKDDNKPESSAAGKKKAPMKRQGRNNPKSKGKPFGARAEKTEKDDDSKRASSGPERRTPRHERGKGKPAGKPIGKPGKPAGKPSGKPVEKSTRKPSGKPAGDSKRKPVGKPKPKKK